MGSQDDWLGLISFNTSKLGDPSHPNLEVERSTDISWMDCSICLLSASKQR